MENVEDIYPLSSLQEGILFHVLNEAHSALYVEQIACALTGRLEVDRLRKAWSETIQRHPVLRTTIHWEDLDQPLQVVQNAIQTPWRVLDWRNLGGEVQTHRLERLMAEDRKCAFDLTEPLHRFVLLRIGEERWHFLWTFHHILLDGWSASMLLREVFAAYDGEDNFAPEKPRPYRDFIAYLQAQDFDGAEPYWRDAIGGIVEPTRLPIANAGHIGGASRPSVTQTEHRLPVALSEAARSVAREHQVTLNTLMQGAWAILLHLYSGESDVLYGVTVSGRPPELRGADRMVGLFINTLPLRVPIDDEKSCGDVLREVGHAFAALTEHENTPLVKIQGWSDVKDGSGLFESILVFENYPSSDTPLSSNLGVDDIRYVEQSNYPLAVLVVPEERIRVIFVHDPKRFSTEAIERLGRHLEGLIRQIVEDPNRAIGQLNVLDTDERTLVLANAVSECTGATGASSWLDLFDAQVALNPDRTAVVCGATTYTYAEMDSRSLTVAQTLKAAGLEKGQRVAICLRRCAEMPVCMLAVHRAGAAYIPIDAAYPPERIQAILEDAAPAMILHAPNFNGAAAMDSLPRFAVDETWSQFPAQPDTPLDCAPSPEDLAYIIYTSGSTGTPRGVKVTHGNLAYSTTARFRYYHEAPVDTFLMPSSFAFDSSVAGIYWTLSDGGTLVIPEEDYARDGDHLAALMEDRGVTHLLCVPSLYQMIVALRNRPFQSLRAVIVAGEPCPSSLVGLHQELMGPARLYNEYGPSECTVWCTVYDCSGARPAGSVPIGRAIPGASIFIVDPRNRILPQGVPGELCVAGPGVTPGYLNLDGITGEKFVTIATGDFEKTRVYKTGDRGRYRDDWQIEFLGRNDDQLQIRGFRVEPGEIEAVLARHEAVSAVAVTASTSSHRPHGQSRANQVPTAEDLIQALNALDPSLAETLLRESERAPRDRTSATHETRAHAAQREGEPPPPPRADGLARDLSTTDFEVSVRLKNTAFIRPPRDSQREWLLGQVMRELNDDLTHLDKTARRFVAGAPRGFDEFDATEDPDDIMEDWQVPLMRSMAACVGETHGDILEIGFGRGVSASMVQDHGVRSHTIIESNAHCIEIHYRPWEQRYADRETRLLHGTWQDKIDALGRYDAILFHAYPLDEEDFVAHVMNSVTFAAHFFPHAAKHLRPGGVFTYLTTEIDSLGRGHQRALLEHFEAITLRTLQVRVPENTRDSWWADSMVVVRAVMPEDKP